jgi:PadR family transcriptional regulator
VIFPPCWKPTRRCYETKKAVLRGALALLILKTLGALRPLHSYGIARRIEHISGDQLAANQGTLYPVL